MILFATFVVALLLTYIGNNYKRK
ncbi:hypothetical protein [Paenibacillus macerans]|nr:hypothetical protein [Paenibacillus macerans]